MGQRTADIAYYVALFHREGDRLVGAAPIRMDDAIAAIGEAQHRAQETGGAIVFACGGTEDNEELEILFRTGDVPDGVPDFFASRT
jgi:hypothetical protein